MCTASHSSDDGGGPSTLQTGLYGNGVLVGLPAYAPTPVSPQCSCATDFPSEIQRPYYRCAYQPSLVAGSRADTLQARCRGVQSATWTCTKLPQATCPRRRCVWSSSTQLGRHKPHLGAASYVHHRRQSSLLGRCPTYLLRGRSLVRRWTCDVQVAGSVPGRWLSRNVGQLSFASLRGR